jgi:hypothetical protein
MHRPFDDAIELSVDYFEVLLMPGILPEIETAGGVVYRDAAGAPTNPPEVSNAYSPAPVFTSSCLLTALPSNCEARIQPAQINAIVSELLSFAECLDPDGTWSCASLRNLCTAFAAWVATNQAALDGKINVPAVPPAITDTLVIWDGNSGRYVKDSGETIAAIRAAAIAYTDAQNAAQNVIINTKVAGPPTVANNLNIAVFNGTTGNLIADGGMTIASLIAQLGGVTVSDAPPANPTQGKLWWKSNSGVLWIWYVDANTGQWVQASGGSGTYAGVLSEADDNRIAALEAQVASLTATVASLTK